MKAEDVPSDLVLIGVKAAEDYGCVPCAAMRAALAAVIPAIQAEALERAAVWHDERADGERALAQAARSAGDRKDAIHHAHLAAEHRASAAAIRALKETT